MDNLLPNFENLKISAFSKYTKITGDVNNVTLGPNSRLQNISQKSESPQRSRGPSSKSVSSEKSPPFQQVLKEYEVYRRQKLEEKINGHYTKFERFAQKQRREKEEQWLRKQQAFIESVQAHEDMILQNLNQDIDSSKANEKLVKHYQDMLHKRQQYEQQLEKNKERQRILSESIEKLKKYQLEFRKVYQDIIILIKTCSSNEELKKQLGENFKLLKSLPETFDEILAKCKSYSIGEEQLTRAANVLLQVKNLKAQIEDAVTQIQKQEAALQQQKTQEISRDQGSDIQCVSIANLKKYLDLKQFLAEHSALFKELLESEQLKQFRFDCKKAVNIPVNAISGVNSEHLRDKYVKLNSLLAGKTVSVADKQINASRHPQGIPFCMDLLAKKFVLQGDLMISSNPEAAHCYSAIIIALWNDFPDFGKLLLAYFYTQCPYLVPFYIPKTEGQSNEDYYKSLGYQYIDGQIEKQDKFLKRMTGILRLYFAITIAKPKSGHAKNPHDIRNAWDFLTSILKMDPQLDITATSLHIFLETVGFEMEAVYGRAFKKLVQIIMEKFMPALKQIDTGGPVTRLEVLLQEYKQKGHFERPNGILAMNFW